MRKITKFLVIICLTLVVCWGLCSFVFAKEKYVPGELLVKFKPDATSVEISSINRQIGCEVIREIKFIQVYHLRITSGLTVEQTKESYSRNPKVEFAEPNYRIELLQGVPDDPRVLNNAERWPDVLIDPTFNPAAPTYGFQWSLDNWGQTGGTVDADIDAPQMWRMITAADPDIIVAILDTGIDWDHEDLEDNIWVNPGEDLDGDGVVGDWADDVNGVDDDDNNYVDDLIGYDFVNGDNDPDDDDSHGTHVAGIVGAVGNNGIGIAGIAWDVQLMPIKVIEPAVMSDHAANVCLGIDYAMHKNAKIMNMSFRLLEYSQAVDLAIDRANDDGILVVAAAGNFASDNDVNPLYPASYTDDNIIAVAASDHNDAIWYDGPGDGSNWGAISVDLAAPGVEIYSTTPGDNYGRIGWTGTSMAAPHVSGVAALCWSLERLLIPGITHLEVKDLLLDDPTSFNAADKEKKPAFRLPPVGVTPVATEGRLRAAQNADFGDAPDPPYPTTWPPLAWGALHLDCGLEWLGADISLERDALDLVTDTDSIPNLVDNDGFDDGATFFPPYFCKGPGGFDRVDVVVTVSNPISGRYGGSLFLYLSSFFDFNNDGDWGDVFTCVDPGDAPEHLLIQGVGGPGAPSVVNLLPDDVVIIDPSLWGPPPTRQSMLFYLYFYSPNAEEVSDTIWTRFRLEYDDQVWPSPDHKFLGTDNDYSLFGEVEDYICLIEQEPTFMLSVVEIVDYISPGDTYFHLYDVTVTPVAGYSLNVDLDIDPASLPVGVTYSYVPAHGIPEFVSELFISCDSGTPYGSHTLTLRGTGADAQVRTKDVTLIIQPPYDEGVVPFNHGLQRTSNFGAIGNGNSSENFVWYGTNYLYDGTIISAVPVEPYSEHMALDVYDCEHVGFIPDRHLYVDYDEEYNANIAYAVFYAEEDVFCCEYDSLFVIGIMEECVDFSIKIKIYYNPILDPIPELYAGVFEDWDVGDYSNNWGDMDTLHNLMWMYDLADPSILFGIMKAPFYDEFMHNMTFIHNPTEAYPTGDSSFNCGNVPGLGYLGRLMMKQQYRYPGYWSPDPDDYSTLIVGSPFSLNPGEKHIEIWIDFGRNLNDGLTWSQWYHRVLRYAGFYRGDVNASNSGEQAPPDLGDLVYLINYLYKQGPAPVPYADQGDVNADRLVALGDLVYLINYIFRNGPPPKDYVRFIPSMWSRPSLFTDPLWQ